MNKLLASALVSALIISGNANAFDTEKLSSPNYMMMGLGVAGAVVGAPAALILSGIGACREWTCFSFSSSNNSAESFDPIDLADSKPTDLKNMQSLVKMYVDVSCTTGAVAKSWNRVSDNDYQNAKMFAKKEVQEENETAKMAEQAEVRQIGTIKASGTKVENDLYNGFGLHSKMMVVRASKANFGFSCEKDIQSGTVTVRDHFNNAEFWINKDHNVVTRLYDFSLDMNKYSKTKVWTEAEIIKNVSGANRKEDLINF
jgi:hypothetical protein